MSVVLFRLMARDSDKSRLDLHGLNTAEALHVLRTTLSKHEAGMWPVVVIITTDMTVWQVLSHMSHENN